MVKRFLSVFSREISGIHSAAYILAFFSFLADILGLLRDRVLAHSFGAGRELDIYYAAFRVPDFIFAAAASLFSFSVLIPFLDEKLRIDKKNGVKFMDTAFTAFLIITVFACAVAFIVMPEIEKFLYPSFSPYALNKTVEISRLLLLSPILLGFSNLIATVTQLERRFIIYALMPVLYNFSIVLGAIFLVPYFGTMGIALGVVLGALLHGLCQVPFVKRSGLMPRVSFPVDKKEVIKITAHSLPRTFTLSAANLALIALVSLASQMAVGSISVLNFSMNLESVPLSIIGVSYAMAAFPILSTLFVTGKKDEFEDLISAAARHIIFYAVPVTALFVVLRAQIVRVILGSGAFTWNDTRLTAAALAIFCLSVVFQCYSMLIARAYYAAGLTKKPLYITLWTMPVVMILPFVLTWLFNMFPSFLTFSAALFKVDDVPGREVIAVPLGYSIGMTIQAIVFFFYSVKDFSRTRIGMLRVSIQSLVVALVSSVVSYIGLDVFGDYLNLQTSLGVFLQGFIAGIFGIIACVLGFYILRSEEFDELVAGLKKSIWKVPIISPEQIDI